MKKYRKEWIALIIFIVILAVSLGWLTKIFTPKVYDFGAMWGSFLCEEKNSIDVMFFGSSIVYCDVVPAVFWRESGLTAYVHAGSEQTLPITLEYIRESLKTQSPGTIFVECTGVSFKQYQGHTKKNIGQMPWGLPRLRATFHSAEPELREGLLFPLVFYHDRWSELTREDFEAYSADPLAGYTWLGEYQESELNCKTMKIKPGDWQRNLEALEDIYALCQKKGITLILYRAPVERISESDWQKLCAAFFGRKGVQLLNCLADQDEIGADDPTCYYDFLHYNARGAEKFSAYLGRWTEENLHFQPQENQNTALWQDRLAYFENLMKSSMVPREE